MISSRKHNSAKEDPDSKIPPFIKWPGGKRNLISEILPLLPESPRKYFEPFLGGGAVYFSYEPSVAALSDLNEELINLYIQVRDDPIGLIGVLKRFRNTESDYYRIRSMICRSPLRRAARTLYLNTLAFNGIHRVNLRGVFNVPYGYKTHLPTCDEDRILMASLALQGSTIAVGDFQSSTKDAGCGDAVYFDPPYTVAHSHNGFVKYNEHIFSWEDQCRLAEHAMQLSRRGCRVVISNADHPSIRELYAKFNVVVIDRFSRIAASSDYRKRIQEVVFYK